MVRINQIAKILQKELGTLFLTETTQLFPKTFISVTTVELSNDLSLAKVYVSFSLNRPLKPTLENQPQKESNNDQEALLQKIDGHKNTIRRLLAQRVAGKMHKIPHLKFMIDRSVIQGARVTALIDQLDLNG